MSNVDNKKIAKNTLFLYFRMILLLAINLYASRLILKLLGIVDFGIYNIVGGVVSMFTFIGGAMTASTQRYLNFYLGKDDSENLKKVFNASLIIHICAAIIIILLCESVGLWFLYNKLVIPVERFNAAFWAFQCSIIATASVVMSYPFNADIIAHEKMSAFAYISIYEALMKLFIIYLLFISPFDRLIVYAICFMMVQISVTIIYRIYCYRHFSEVKLNIHGFSWKMTKDITTFSGWNFLGNISAVLLLQGTNILLNLFFGPAVNAAKGISVQVQNVVNQFFTNFQTAQNPQIVKTYASGEFDEMHKLIFRSTRWSYFLALIIIVPIFYKITGILCIWLTEVPQYTATFVRYALIYSLILTMAMPVHMGVMATGNVRRLMIGTSVIFFLVIPLGYILLYVSRDPIGIFKLMLLLYILAQIVRVNIASHQLNFSRVVYLKSVVLPIFIVTLLSFLICGMLSLLFNNSFVHIVIFSFFACTIVTFLSFIIGLSKNERIKIIQIIKHKIK